MTTLMRNDRDRRSGKPGMGHARKERVLLFGTRSADYIRASSQSGCIQRPNTWLHPNVSLNCPIFPLHRGRRPYMAHCVISLPRKIRSLLEGGLNRSPQHSILTGKDGVYGDATRILSGVHCGREDRALGSLAAWRVAEGNWASIW